MGSVQPLRGSELRPRTAELGCGTHGAAGRSNLDQMGCHASPTPDAASDHKL